MNIGLFFGSFNPIHNGHLIIANMVLQKTNLKQIWFVVSPQSPFKTTNNLLKEHDRLFLVKLAIENNPNFRASDIEFTLPKPSYTIDTLTHLKEKYPKHQFSIIMGGDNITSFHKWKNADIILRDYSIYVYNRNSETNPYLGNKNIHFLQFPLLDISATFIRDTIKEGLSVQYFLPDNVWEYILQNNYYKK